jgi:hypothetical protein
LLLEGRAKLKQHSAKPMNQPQLVGLFRPLETSALFPNKFFYGRPVGTLQRKKETNRRQHGFSKLLRKGVTGIDMHPEPTAAAASLGQLLTVIRLQTTRQQRRLSALAIKSSCDYTGHQSDH